MTTADTEIAMQNRLKSATDTRVADEDSLASTYESKAEKEKRYEAWRNLINEPLIDWGKDPNKLEDDGIVAPTKDIITLALTYAMALRDAGWPAPTSVVPNGAGGIAFEKRSGRYHEIIEIYDDASAELITFHDSNLIGRKSLPRQRH